jgi:glycosyltransferase involved in cell wall biosynthesis
VKRFFPLLLLTVALLFFVVNLREFFPSRAKKEKLCLKLSSLPPTPEAPPFFAILISAHNPGKLCRKTLESVLEQKYPNFRILYIDKGSTDGSFEQMQEFVASLPQREQVVLIQTEDTGIEWCRDEEIAVFLPAKDWLAHDQVLQWLSRAYQQEGVWMICGGSRCCPSYKRAKKRSGLKSVYASLCKQGKIDEDHVYQFPATLSIHYAPIDSVEELIRAEE